MDDQRATEDRQTTPVPVNSDCGRTKKSTRSDLAAKRKAAKVGMAVSLGVLVGTGLMGGRRTSSLHIWSGVSLIGFSIWHYSLYKPSKR